VTRKAALQRDLSLIALGRRLDRAFQDEGDMTRYNVRQAEAKWQRVWDERRAFAVTDDPSKPKTYVLEMFPYPSGRIHMGHVRNYTMGDMIARYKRAKGFNVLHPMGWDAFGLPAENAALERGVHPGAWTYENIKTMRGQLKSMGLAIDWDREIATCRPEYYRFEQRMFLDFLKAGLAYRKESWVNWDPVDNTVLANEQVIDGRGWRTGALVEKRKLSQWFLKITHFADDLLDAIASLDRWPEKVRLMQENWIGKSYGCRFFFHLSHDYPRLEVFTTRPDTLYGASFVAISPQHPLALAWAKDDPALADFIAACNRMGTSEVAVEQAEKQGYRTQVTARHPFMGQVELPVYVANFVLMDYGTGAIFGCPAHDQRDLDFARKYALPVRPVVVPEGEDAATFAVGDTAYVGPGLLANSDFLDGMTVEQAKMASIGKLENAGEGQRAAMYRLRDWGVSRQRYWGCPIPVIHCPSCGVVPVPDADLPVTLPPDVSFDQPGNPLDRHPHWKHVSCPQCGAAAERETDTFDTFIESSWYFLRFADPRNPQAAFDPAKIAYWLPVDHYIGGVEHAVLHLLYARFWTKALAHCGYLDLKEPFAGLFTQGMVTHATFQDADGKWLLPSEIDWHDGKAVQRGKDDSTVKVGPVIKMSKSKKNVVDPEGIIDSYGADAARLFMMSDSPPDRDLEWTEAGIDGAWRYMNRLWRMVTEPGFDLGPAGGLAPDAFDALAMAVRRSAHKAAAQVADDIEHYRFNTAIAKMRSFTNILAEAMAACVKQGDVLSADARFALREGLEYLVQLMQPVMPHLTQELWLALGHADLLVDRSWPVADPALAVDETVTIGVQVAGKLRATIIVPRDMDEDQVRAIALAQENVQRAIDGKPVRRAIVVANRIVNIVL
jgi:leucyl-tRNA synthetase